MAVKLLPDPWKLWHPIVFGILFTIGAGLTQPLVRFVMGMLSAAQRAAGSG